MEILKTPAAMAAFSKAHHARGERLALVPTMGYLHAGHLALMAEAKRHADTLVVSVFVNPIQFNNADDLLRYPQDEAGDLAKCAAAGAAAVYLPTAAAMYAPDFCSGVSVSQLSEPLCGRTRPGHFAGVTTVVAKLFNAVAPQVAVFGQKDYQQLAIIRRMVRDLDYPIEIIGHPILRDTDGLALSSRNARLSPEARTRALALPQALLAAQNAFLGGERRVAKLLGIAGERLDSGAPESVDYLEALDADTLTPLGETLSAPAVLAAAATFGGVRLIDNRLLRDRDRGECG